MYHTLLDLRYENVILIIHWHNRYYSKEKGRRWTILISSVPHVPTTVPHIQSVTKQWDYYYNNRYTLTVCTYTFMYYMAPFSGGLQISHISWIWGLPRKLPRKLADILSWPIWKILVVTTLFNTRILQGWKYHAFATFSTLLQPC